MHRWFPIPAALAVALWAIVLSSIATGGTDQTDSRFRPAAVAILAVHGGVLIWSRGRRGEGWPEWAQVQEAKHRRKGGWFAFWGIVVLIFGHGGPPGPVAWFGASLNLGFQPGMFLAEWATIAAEHRLMRSMAGRGPG